MAPKHFDYELLGTPCYEFLIDSVCCIFFFLYEIYECADILKYVIGIDAIQFKAFVAQQIGKTLSCFYIIENNNA